MRFNLKMKRLEWKIHAKQADFKYKVRKSQKIIHETLSLNKLFAISLSGGKDSTAMAFLVKSIDKDVPIIMQIDDCDWPELIPYVDRLQKKYDWTINFAEPSFSVIEKMQKIDRLNEDFCALTHPLTRDAFITPLKDRAKELNINGFFIGLRNRESKARKLNNRTRGSIYFKKDGFGVSLPMADWCAKDIFAYLVENNVEINPCYFKNRFEQPEDIRLAWFAPTRTGERYGAVEQIKYYNPDLLRKLNA